MFNTHLISFTKTVSNLFFLLVFKHLPSQASQSSQGSHSANYISLCHKSVNILCLKGNSHSDINSLQSPKRMKKEFQRTGYIHLPPKTCGLSLSFLHKHLEPSLSKTLSPKLKSDDKPLCKIFQKLLHTVVRFKFHSLEDEILQELSPVSSPVISSVLAQHDSQL